MAQFLGLISTESLASYREENARRAVFYDYPNGRFPLMGLLSLMEETETLTDPVHGWWEERYKSVRTLTSAVPSSGVGPFASAVGTAYGANVTKASGASLVFYVVDNTNFRINDSVRIASVVLNSGSSVDLTGIVTAMGTGVDAATNWLTITMQDSNMVAALYTTTNNSLNVSMIGKAYAEGAKLSGSPVTPIPLLVQNYTQIFRTTATYFTGTSLKMGVRYDQTGEWRQTTKKNALIHMESMEKAAFFGVRYTQNITDDEGDTVPQRTLGGIEWYLKQWDLGNVVNGGAFDYRPGEANLTAADYTLASSDMKRVINITGGTISDDVWQELIRRIFFKCSDRGYEKLVVCGDKTLAAINAWAKKASIKVDELNSKEDSYGMKISKIQTIHGDLYFKTHPLFKEDPMNQNKMFVLDMGDIVYHPFMDRDTTLLKNRQTRDRDKRKDEWLTEMGIEVRFPERHMLINGLTGIRA